MSSVKKSAKAKSTRARLIENFLSLSVLQMINYIVPLVTFPYLVRVLGVEQFGLFSFVMAVINYGIIITDYGFDLSATKKISSHKEEAAKIDEIFSSVLIIKSVMALLFLLILTLLIVTVERFGMHASLYYLAFGIVVGQALFPGWFFQGIEQMRYITMLNALSKTLFAGAIFLFVHRPQDLFLVFLFNALGGVFAAMLALWVAYSRFGVRMRWQPWERLFYYLQDGWYIFTSRVAVQLYQGINIIILGFFTSNTVVGYYSIAYKIVHAVGTIASSLTRALYPYLNTLYEASKERFYRQNLLLSLLIVTVMTPVAILMFLYAEEILALVMGKTPPAEAVLLLRIFAPALALFLFGTQFTNILVILDEKRLLNNIVLIAGVINVVTAPLLIYWYGAVGLMWLNLFFVLFIFSVKGYYIFFRFRRRDLHSG